MRICAIALLMAWLPAAASAQGLRPLSDSSLGRLDQSAPPTVQVESAPPKLRPAEPAPAPSAGLRGSAPVLKAAKPRGRAGAKASARRLGAARSAVRKGAAASKAHKPVRAKAIANAHRTVTRKRR